MGWELSQPWRNRDWFNPLVIIRFSWVWVGTVAKENIVTCEWSNTEKGKKKKRITCVLVVSAFSVFYFINFLNPGVLSAAYYGNGGANPC